jgi:type III secretory pathway component EscR
MKKFNPLLQMLRESIWWTSLLRELGRYNGSNHERQFLHPRTVRDNVRISRQNKSNRTLGKTPKTLLSHVRYTLGTLSISHPTVSLRESQLKRSVAMGKITDDATSRLLPTFTRTDLEFFYSIDFTILLYFILLFYIEI